MAEASLQKESPPIFLVEDSISSKESVPVLHEPRDSTGKKACSSQRKQEKGKTTTNSSSRTSAKLSDLENLENKLAGQFESRFSSLDGKLEKLLGVLSSSNGSEQRRPDVNKNVESSASGSCRPPNQGNDISDVRRPLLPLDNSLDKDFGIVSHNTVISDDDVISLQPGQVECQGMGLLSSEGSDRIELAENEKVAENRFQKYSALSTSKETETLTHDILTEMFGEDAQANISNQNIGLRLDKAQIDVLNSSWRCQAPEKLTAYRDSYKQTFPVHESSEKMLQVPSLDELSERLLIKKHGRRAAFGNSQALFTQPFKSIEKIAFQGQLAACMGIISLCYAQQALGLLLTNLKKDSPNLDQAVQNVRDIFAISTKSLDQMCRSGAFHQLIRRKATVADTGLHEFKDLQKSALTSPLSGEGIFGSEFEKKLKDRQEKDKQLSELMPEFSKRAFGKRKSSFSADSSSQKKPRQSDDSYRPNRSSDSFNSNSRKAGRGGSYSSRYNSRGSSSKTNSVGSFQFQGNKSNKA